MSEKSKHKPYAYRIPCFLLLLCSLVSLCCVFNMAIVGNNFESNLFCFHNFPPSETDIEKLAFFKLPSSAIHLEYTAQLSENKDCLIWVRLEMNSSDLDTFRASTLVEVLASSSVDADWNNLFAPQGWKLPKKFLAGSFSKYKSDWHPYAFQKIIVDTTDSKTFVVYIFASSDRI